GASRGRRWPYPRAARRHGVRAGGHRLLRCLRHAPAAVGQRRAAGAGRRLVARLRRVAGVPPAQSVRSDHPRQRPPLPRHARRQDGGLVVRRRLRPDPVLSIRRGRAALAPHRARPVRTPWRRCALRRAQALVRRVLFPEAPRGYAWRRWPVLRRPARGLPVRLRLPARGRRRLPRCLPADRRATPGHAIRRARTRVPAVPARPLRRVQPGLRPRHPVRPAVRRPRRIDPDEPAAARALGIRLRTGTRQRRSEAGRVPAPPRLAGYFFFSTLILPSFSRTARRISPSAAQSCSRMASSRSSRVRSAALSASWKTVPLRARMSALPSTTPATGSLRAVAKPTKRFHASSVVARINPPGSDSSPAIIEPWTASPSSTSTSRSNGVNCPTVRFPD